MKKCLILLLFLACEEPYDKYPMTVSDACEIQFWPVGEESFNTKQDGYTDYFCYNQKFLCTSLRRIQAFDEDGGIDDLTLSIENSDGEEVESLAFTKTPSLFLTSLNEGDQTGAGTAWTIDDDPNLSIVGFTSSQIFRVPLLGAKAGNSYTVHYKFTKTGNAIGEIYLRFYDSLMTLLLPQKVLEYTSLTTLLEDDFTFTGDELKPSYIGVYVLNTTLNGSMTINEVSLVVNEVSPTIYDLSFSPYDYSLCDSLIRFRIKRLFVSSPIVNPSFIATISPWLQELTNDEWEWISGDQIECNGASKSVYQNVNLSDTTYDLSYSNSRTISFGTCIVTGFTQDINGNTLSSFVIPLGTGTISVDGYVGGVQVAKIGFRAGGSFLGTVRFQSFELTGTGSDEELFYSDECLFVSSWANSDHEGRVNIQYKSIQNFADLIYDSSSPYFSIDLDGRFRKERKQTTQKSIELTSMVINTAMSVKRQRKLTINEVPDYMHTKINLILAHSASGSVLIDGKEWSVEEAYEELAAPDSHPVTMAEIFLSEKNYLKQNVI